MSIGKIIGPIVVFVLFVLLISDPPEIVFYRIPLQSDLKYSVGVVKLRYAYKSGERAILKADVGDKIFVCRGALSGVMQAGNCPLGKDEEALVDGKYVRIG